MQFLRIYYIILFTNLSLLLWLIVYNLITNCFFFHYFYEFVFTISTNLYLPFLQIYYHPLYKFRFHHLYKFVYTIITNLFFIVLQIYLYHFDYFSFFTNLFLPFLHFFYHIRTKNNSQLQLFPLSGRSYSCCS